MGVMPNEDSILSLEDMVRAVWVVVASAGNV